MADVKFLGNLVVDGNISLTAGGSYQIKNATFESLTADPTGDLFEGRMIYRSDTNQIRFYNGSAWASIAGDILGVTAGDGLGGGGATGTVSLSVNVDDVTTEISSDTVRAKTATITDGGESLATGGQIYSFVTGQGYITGNQTITLSGDVTGSGTTAITTTIAANAVEGSMLNNNVISGQTALTTGIASTDELMISDAGTLKRIDASVLQEYMQDNLTFTTNSDVNVSVTNLETRLGQIDSNVSIGSGSGVAVETSGNLTVGGNLIVEGTTTTVNSTTLTVDDHHIKVATDNNAANDFGFYGRYNSTAEFAGLTYDVSADSFELYSGNGTEPGNTTFTPDNRASLKVNRLDAAAFTLGGTGVTSTAAELNKLDGFTGVVADLNYAKDLRATGVTASEFNILDGVTSTAAEINKLDGFTGVVADLNYAKDLRATDVTSTEFDYLDGVTSNIQTQLDAKQATVSGGTGITFSSNTVNLDYAGTDNFVLSATDNSATDLTEEDFILVHKDSSGNVGRVKYTDIPGVGTAATTTQSGIVELATNAETRTGTSTTRVLTPSNLSDIKYIATIGDGTATSYTVTHGLGSRRVMVQMYDSSSYETVYAQVVRTTTTAITVDFNSAPAANDVTVMVELMM